MITTNPLELFPPECLVLTRCSPLTPPYLGNQTLSSIIKQQAGLVFLKCLRKLVWVLFLHFPPKILRACFCVPIFQSWVWLENVITGQKVLPYENACFEKSGVGWILQLFPKSIHFLPFVSCWNMVVREWGNKHCTMQLSPLKNGN